MEDVCHVQETLRSIRESRSFSLQKISISSSLWNSHINSRPDSISDLQHKLQRICKRCLADRQSFPSSHSAWICS
eukprot:m.150764 g.150764  ORF g.150764 m.150764 type:complete len:75 (+) comp38556_c0_seq3:107-331(+)